MCIRRSGRHEHYLSRQIIAFLSNRLSIFEVSVAAIGQPRYIDDIDVVVFVPSSLVFYPNYDNAFIAFISDRTFSSLAHAFSSCAASFRVVWLSLIHVSTVLAPATPRSSPLILIVPLPLTTEPPFLFLLLYKRYHDRQYLLFRMSTNANEATVP